MSNDDVQYELQQLAENLAAAKGRTATASQRLRQASANATHVLDQFALKAKIASTLSKFDNDVDLMLDGKELAGICLLMSGGNDSTVMGHLLRHKATHVVHVNTGIGIEQTRQFVRDLARRWEIPLLEKSPPPGSTYRELVLDQGFPGPGHHWKMYQRLKERALREVRRELVANGRRQRVVFVAGRRRDESARRMNIPDKEREGSIIWLSPMADWSKADLNLYRRLFDVPHNEVADMLHMSGECGCGAFAKQGELEEWSFFFPEFGECVRQLESEVAVEVQRGAVPAERAKWGWGARSKASDKPVRTGILCSSCDARQEQLFFIE